MGHWYEGDRLPKAAISKDRRVLTKGIDGDSREA